MFCFRPTVLSRSVCQQLSPTTVEDRALGLIIGDVHCWSLDSQRIGLQPQVLLGLPLTLLLLTVLLGLLDVRSHWLIAFPLMVLVATAGLGTVRPWESRAVQPAFQSMLLAATRRDWAVVLGAFAQAARYRDAAGGGLGGQHADLLYPGHSARRYGLLCLCPVSCLSTAICDLPMNLIRLRSPFRTTNLAYAITSTGYTPNPWSVGPAILWTPFWLLAHLLTGLGHWLGLGWVADGYAPPYVVLVTLASALAGLATLFGMFVLTRRWFAAPDSGNRSRHNLSGLEPAVSMRCSMGVSHTASRPPHRPGLLSPASGLRTGRIGITGCCLACSAV